MMKYTAEDFERGANRLSLSSKAYPVDSVMLLAALLIAHRVMQPRLLEDALVEANPYDMTASKDFEAYRLTFANAIRTALTSKDEEGSA